MGKNENSEVLSCLSEIFMAEMGGVMRYLHYSFMIMGHNRIPIQKWFRDKATEGVDHATIIGEKITALGGHPPMEQVKIEESNVHSVNAILNESLSFERHGLELYKNLFT